MTNEISVQASPDTFQFVPKKTALLVIDMQKDFIDSGGFGESLGNDVSELTTAVESTKVILEACRDAGIQVIHTREGHRPDLSNCPSSKQNRGPSETKIGDEGPMGRLLVEGSEGQGVIDELQPKAGEPVIDKPGKGAFYATDLDLILRTENIEQLLITGVTTEVCVHSTVREANDRGYECLVLEDCVGSYFPEFHQTALEMIASQGGIFGWTTPSACVLESL